MCSPAAGVVSPDVELRAASASDSAALGVSAVPTPSSLRQRIGRWLVSWKQTLIAELASIGSPKEGFQ